MPHAETRPPRLTCKKWIVRLPISELMAVPSAVRDWWAAFDAQACQGIFRRIDAEILDGTR